MCIHYFQVGTHPYWITSPFVLTAKIFYRLRSCWLCNWRPSISIVIIVATVRCRRQICQRRHLHAGLLQCLCEVKQHSCTVARHCAHAELSANPTLTSCFVLIGLLLINIILNHQLSSNTLLYSHKHNCFVKWWNILYICMYCDVSECPLLIYTTNIS